MQSPSRHTDCKTTESESGTREYETDLCHTRSCEHFSYPFYEPVLPGRVKAPPTCTSLGEVVLLGNAHLLTVARDLHVLVGVLL